MLARFGAPAPNRASIELTNMLTVARCVVLAALERTESRGAHYRTDYMATDDDHWRRHILLRCADGELKVEYRATG